MSVKTESRDRKQKEAAAVFVVAEECGNVEALCQTFLKWGQVTFSQRGKATSTTTKWGGMAAPASLRRGRQPGQRGEPARAQRAQFPAGVGRPRRCLRCRASGWTRAGRDGLCSRRRRPDYLCGPRPASDPSAGSGGSFLRSSRNRLNLLRRILNGVNVRNSVLAAVSANRTLWGSRHLFL